MNEAMKSSCEKLMTAVNALAAQTGESPESLIDWLADNGGLTKLILSYFSGNSTVKESLTVQAQQSCEPVHRQYRIVGAPTGWRDTPFSFVSRTQSVEHRDLFEFPPDYEALRAERDRLKQDLADAILLKDGYLQEYRDLESVSEVQLEGLRAENLHLMTDRDKLQQLLMTALDTGRAAIAERDALKEALKITLAKMDEAINESPFMYIEGDETKKARELCK